MMGQTREWNSYIAEALGTFLFLGTGIGVAYSVFGQDWFVVSVAVALAFGLALVVMVSAFGAISGAHFNPAVTFGLWMAGKIDPVKAVGYIIAQLIGVVAAAVVIRFVFSPEVPSTAGLTALNEAAGIDLIKGIVVEAMVTMVLLAAVFGTAVDARAPRIGGLAIGLALAAGILFAGNLTGGAVNPARWFGPAVVAGDFSGALVYIVGPLLGAGIVALVYRLLILPEAEAAAATQPLVDVPEESGG